MVDAGDVVDGRDAGDMGRQGRGTWDAGRGKGTRDVGRGTRDVGRMGLRRSAGYLE